jgi:hypothetical protein
MPITQQPTLNNIEPDSGQFEIVFGVQITSPENRQSVTIPNLGPMLADVFTLDMLNIVSPARGNVPSVRSMQFAIRSWMPQTAGAPPQSTAIYFVNTQTNQVIAITEPTPGPQFDGLVMGCVPFFCKSNQSIAIYRAANGIQNCFSFLSVSLFTFDCSAYLAAMTPTPSMFSVTTPFVLPVRLE